MGTGEHLVPSSHPLPSNLHASSPFLPNLLLASSNFLRPLKFRPPLDSRELLYTSTPGASAGKLGPFIGDVEQRIDLKAAQYDNVVKIGGGAVEAVLSARWEVPKDGKGNTWLVLFNDIRIK